jgi:hypothetical protein
VDDDDVELDCGSKHIKLAISNSNVYGDNRMAKCGKSATALTVTTAMLRSALVMVLVLAAV